MVVRESTPYLSPADPTFARFKNDILTVAASAPLPPGSRVDFPLVLHRAAKTVQVAGKIVQVRRLGERAFEMAVRLHTLGREEREGLVREQTLLVKEQTVPAEEQTIFVP